MGGGSDQVYGGANGYCRSQMISPLLAQIFEQGIAAKGYPHRVEGGEAAL